MRSAAVRAACAAAPPSASVCRRGHGNHLYALASPLLGTCPLSAALFAGSALLWRTLLWSQRRRALRQDGARKHRGKVVFV